MNLRRWREWGIFSLRDSTRLAVRFPRYALRLAADCAMGVRHTGFPRRIGLFLTNRCDFACEMCAVLDLRAAGLSHGDMPLSTVEQVLSEASRYQPLVDFIGGEPLLYGRLAEALRAASKRRVIAVLTTNGLKLKRHADLLVAAELPVLQVSLDGWDELSQRARGNVKGSFDSLLEGVRAVKAARGKSAFPIIRVLTAITRTNHAHLDRIQQVVADMGVPYWGITNYFYVNRKAHQAHQLFALANGLSGSVSAHAIEGDVYLTPAQVLDLKDSLQRVRLLNRRFGLRIAYAWDIDLDAYYSAREASRRTLCALPFSRLDIHADGHMAVCVSGKRVGKVGQTPIVDVWRGKTLTEYRGMYRRARPMPMCFRWCGLSQNIRF